jgi:hypothetical protein
MLFSVRSMGELAHPNTDYAYQLAALRDCTTVHKRANYLIDNDFSTAALVGTIAEGDRRNGRFAAFARQNGRILFNPENLDTTGRELGIGLQPQVNYDTIAEAVIANSDTLTPRDLIAAKAKVASEVTCGAWLYSPFQPRRSSKGEGIAGHVDAFLVPDDGTPTWWMTSLINPTLTNSEVVIERMQNAGFSAFHPSPPRTLLEMLYADAPPNSMVGNWNILLAGTIDDAGKDLTFARLAAAQANKPDQVLYETMIVTKIWLSVERYRDARVLFELQERSKAKSPAYPLSIGTHSGINSCAQFTGAIFDTTGKVRCLNLQSAYDEAIKDSVECWVTDAKNKEIFALLEGDDPDFRLITKSSASRTLATYLSQSTLNKSNRSDRAAYCENYIACTMPHPDPDGAAFYEAAADIALELITNYPQLN